MVDKEQIIQVVFNAIDELNEQISSEKQLKKSLETPLFGQSGKLDSLDLVNLVFEIQDNIEETTGQTITLASDKAMSQKHSPFNTITSLVNYIITLLNGEESD